MIDALLTDMRYALRSLARAPGFSAIAALVLAVGIGTATAGYSVANWLLWRPVPGTKDDGRLATVWIGHRIGTTGFQAAGLSYPNYSDLVRSVPALAGLAAQQQEAVSLEAEGTTARRIDAEYVTPGYFAVLGAELQRGRLFTPDEDRPPDGTPVAVISDRLWGSEFNRDPAAIGRAIRLNGRLFTVIGVAAPHFHGAPRLGTADVWLPASTELYVRHYALPPRAAEREVGRLLYFVARLAPGATFAQAQAQLDAGTRHLAKLHPDVNQEFALQSGAVLYPGIGTNPLARPSLATSMRLIVGLTALVLMIACANTANLLLFRNIATSGEAAIRRALGGSFGRVVRQHVSGSVLLALAGGAMGVLLSTWLVRLFHGVRFTYIEVGDLSLDWRVLAFACGASLLTGVLAGLAPALSAARGDPHPVLRATGPTGTAPRASLRRVLAVTQVALGVTLLVGALLLTRTLQNLARVDLGFDAAGVTIVAASPDEQGYSPYRVRAYWASFSRQLSETPGVQAVSLAATVPLIGMTWGARIRVANRSDAHASLVSQDQISSAYFRTLRIPVVRGSGFTDADSSQDIVALSAGLARQLFGAADPIGQFVELDAGRPSRVVGMIADIRSTGLEGDPEPLVYRPLVDARVRPVMLVRSTLSSRDIGTRVERIAAALDSALPIDQVRPLSALVDRYMSEPRLFARVLSLLALIALGLAAAGLYGLVGFGVALRTREFGIRTALGAEPASILRLVLRESARLAAVGVMLGLAGAALGTRIIQHRLYGVTPLDPVSYAAAAAVLALVVLLASLRPARMATRVDPVKALRSE